MKKKLGRLLVVLLSIALCMQLMVPLASTVAFAANRSVTINLTNRYQTMEGWGTSIAWWGNMIGDWTQPGASGKELRDELSDLLFSDEGLGLNIIRYNIGGGDDPSHDHLSRLEAHMPGFAASEADIMAGIYDWDKDANQVYSMKKAISTRETNRAARGISNDIITEFFSNSPPWFLTRSLCTVGYGTSTSNTGNNIADNKMPTFAKYLADVTNHFAGEGIKIDYLVPLNEGDSKHWNQNADQISKQEGCMISAGTSQNALYDAMRAQTLPADTSLAGLDETSTAKSISSWNSLSNANKEAIAKFGTHTYEANERSSLRTTIANAGKKLWMNEVCVSTGNWAPTSMSTPMQLNTSLLADLKDMRVSAWIFWQAIENLLECTKYNGNWGLITAAYYHPDDAPGNRWGKGAVGNNFSNSSYKLSWDGRSGTTKVSVGDYWIGKNYYVLGQYSKFIRQGYTIVDSTTASGVQQIAAISPDGQELVIVATNNNSTSSSNTHSLTYTISGATNANLTSVEAYRTSASMSLTPLPASSVTLSGNQVKLDLPGQTVTTIVVKAANGKIHPTATILTDKATLDGRIAALQSVVQGTMPGSTYSNVTWTPFQEARRIANLVSNERGASQADVNTALDALNDTYAALTIAVSNKTDLDARIAYAKTIDKGYFTDNSWDILQLMIGNGEAVSADPGVIQVEVDEALTKLNNAITGLILKPVDKTGLIAAIATYEGLTESDWSSASWSNARGYYTTAVAVNNATTPAASQGEVNTATENLTTALNTLTVDKTDLAAVILSYNSLIEADYSTASWISMMGHYNAAKDMNTNAAAKQSEVNQAAADLTNAYGALTVDKSALITAIESYDGLIETDYSTASWNSMEDAYAAALIVNDNLSAKQSEINTAAANLANTIGDLIVDKTDLAAVILSYDSLIETDYSTASWSSMKAIYGAAMNMNANLAAKQSEVDAIKIALASAIASLSVDKSELNAAISSYIGLIESDWSPASWSNAKGAYDAAVLVRGASPDAKQSEIDAAKTALLNAIADLVSNIDKSALIAAIESYDGLIEANYSAASWSSMEAAYAAALIVNGSDTVTQSEINTAAENLANAIASLDVDRTGLAAAIADYDDLTETDWPADAWAALTLIYDAAVDVNGDPDAKQSEINTAAENLTNALAALKVDKTGLAAAIADGAARTEGDYSPASWSSMIGFYNAAVIVNNNLDAKQSEINTATENLTNALAALTVDKTALETAIASYGSHNAADWPSGLWDAVVTAHGNAATVNESPAADRKSVV